MRAWSVVRFIPRTTAAPLGPAIRHSVRRSARRMCWRSASSRVEIEALEEAEGAKEAELNDGEETSPPPGARKTDFRSETGTRSSLPGERSTARSMKFSSSRILPGQEYPASASIASAGTKATDLLSRRLNFWT